MDRISRTELERVARPQTTSPSTTQCSPSTGERGGKIRAMCELINRHRISRGWHALTAADAEVHANVWIDVLDNAQVPVTAYHRLYQRATDARTNSMRRGEEPPDFSAELLVTVWEGPNGVRAEMAEALAHNRKLSCPYCHGTGMRPYTPPDGKYPGVRRCSHF